MKTDKNNINEEEENFKGYPSYPENEDIYLVEKKAQNINPDDNSIIKTDDAKEGEWNEKDYDNELTGDDLDVPGSELDDADEDIGNEDEENNYYSLGGDNHDDLEEDNGGEPKLS